MKLFFLSVFSTIRKTVSYSENGKPSFCLDSIGNFI